MFFTILIIGAGGIIAQTVLLRELLVSFLGNELTLGLIIGSWMLGEAAGALIIGKLSTFIKDKKALLVWLMLVFSASAVASCAGARIFKPFLNIPVGQGIGTGAIFLISLALSFSVSFCHGGLFSLCCSMSNVTRVYILETIGTLAGGALLAWLLIPNFGHFSIIIAVAVVSTAICLTFLNSLQSKVSRSMLYPVVIACLLFFLMLKPAGVEQYTLARQYPQGKVLDYRNSVYGNAVVTQKQGQRVFFYNGVPAVTTPVPDITFAQDLGHLPLIFCENPKEIMVIGSGLGGLISEILAEPVSRVDFCQQDRLIARMLWKYPSKLTSLELMDPRLNVIHKDGRTVLRDVKQEYDAIIIGSPVPADLSSNRYFTREFFSAAAGKLKPKGVLALCLPGSTAYLSPQVRDINYLILNALSSQFSSVRVIPGDYNIILASDSAMFNVEPPVLYRRLLSRKVRIPLLNPAYLKYRLDGQFLDWFRRSSSGATDQVNTDDKPAAVYQVLISWNKQFSGTTMAVLQWFSHIRLWMVLLAIGAGGVSLLAWFKIRPLSSGRPAVLYAISTTGFFGMAMNLALIFSFQMRYGYVYQIIGALTAVFMAGAASGSMAMRYISRRGQTPNQLIINEASIAGFVMISFLIISRLQYGIFFTPLYMILCFISGALLGAEFPLAVSIYGGKKNEEGLASGIVFCADLVGGVLAAFLAGVVLLPLLGVSQMLIALAVLKSLSAIILCFVKKIKKI